MWPMLLDYTRDECKRILRKLELEAYASVISAFRAQGELSKEKKRMLNDLSSALSISLERHRAEVRRAVNDEHLYTIADRLSGPNTATEWAIEGRRLVPLMPRLVPQTAFTAIANSAANAQAAKNASLPVPSATGLKENSENENMENEHHGRKRSSSMELSGTPQKIMATGQESPCPFVPVPPVTSAENTRAVSPVNNTGSAVVTRTVTLPVGPNPLKIALTTTSHRTTSTASTSSAHKQVIFMSTSSSPTSPNVLQRSLSVPIVKTVSTSATSISTHQSKPLLSISGSVPSSNPPSHTISSPMPMDVDSLYAGASSTPSPILSPTPPLFSSGSFTQTISTSTAPMNSPVLPKSRSKTASVPRQPVRPKSNPNSVVVSQTPVTTHQGVSAQLPVPNQLQTATRTVSPISKARSPASRTPSPGSAGHIPRSQSPGSSQAVPRAQSPVSTTVPSLHLPVSNAPRSVSPISVSRPQSPVSVQSAPKTVVSPKSINKSSVHRPQPGSGTRTLLTPTCKTQTKSLPSVSTSMPCTVRTPLQPSVRACAPSPQVLPSRPSLSSAPQHKIFQGAGHVQVKSASASPRIQYNTDSGLKIITQNVPSSRILPKPPPPASTTQNLSGPTNRITPIVTANSGVPSNARVVSLQQQPVGTRMARAIAPSSITTVGLPGLRVTLPAGALSTPAVVRATAPGAKPNVILVHKAQVWSQSQGATIVMSSSGPMSRIPAEAVHEAVSFFQRQDRNKPTPGTVTLVKQVPVSQTASLLSSTNVISSSTPIPVCPVSTVSGLQTFPAENLNKEQCSNLQTQDKSVDSECKNTILADLVQLAGIIPENNGALPADLQRVEILPVKSDAELSESHETEETGAKTVDDDSCTEQVAEDEDDEDEEEEIYDDDCVNISETAKIAGNIESVRRIDFLSETSSKDASKTARQETSSSDVSSKELQKSEKYSILDTSDDCSSSAINIQDINFDQLPEGQILELQAQDAAELLSQHGQLSSEVLELLQQAGLQVHQVDVEDDETDVTKISNPKPSEGATESPVLHEDQSVKQKEKLETKLDPQTGILYISEDLKHDAVGAKIISDAKGREKASAKNEDEAVVDIFSTALASAQLDLHSLEFVGDVSESGNVAISSSCENGNLKKS